MRQLNLFENTCIHSENPRVFRLTVPIEEIPKPGQFYMVKLKGNAPLLARPFAAYDVDYKNRTLTLLYEVRGEGTEMLSRVENPEQIEVYGPYGKALRVNSDNILILAGGIGLAPLAYFVKYQKLTHPESKIEAVLGYRTTPFASDLFIDNCDKVTVLKNNKPVQVGKIDRDQVVITCGPDGMIKSLCSTVPAVNDLYFGLESRMACGLGACLGCVKQFPVTYKESSNGKLWPLMMEQVKVCTDGPFFKREVFNG